MSRLILVAAFVTFAAAVVLAGTSAPFDGQAMLVVCAANNTDCRGTCPNVTYKPAQCVKNDPTLRELLNRHTNSESHKTLVGHDAGSLQLSCGLDYIAARLFATEDCQTQIGEMMFRYHECHLDKEGKHNKYWMCSKPVPDPDEYEIEVTNCGSSSTCTGSGCKSFRLAQNDCLSNDDPAGTSFEFDCASNGIVLRSYNSLNCVGRPNVFVQPFDKCGKGSHGNYSYFQCKKKVAQVLVETNYNSTICAGNGSAFPWPTHVCMPNNKDQSLMFECGPMGPGAVIWKTKDCTGMPIAKELIPADKCMLDHKTKLHNTFSCVDEKHHHVKSSFSILPTQEELTAAVQHFIL